MTPMKHSQWLIRFDNFVDQSRYHNIQLIIDYITFKTLEMDKSKATDVRMNNEVKEVIHTGQMDKKKAVERKLEWFREIPKRSYDDFANIQFEPLEIRSY